METRRRHVGPSIDRSRPDIVYEDVRGTDDECECEDITSDILKVYEDSEDERPRRPYYATHRDLVGRRKPISDAGAYMLLFCLLAVVIFVVNIRSQKELAKIKSNMGYEEKKPNVLFWWNSAIIYYLDLATFQDSDDDGVGDIRGIFAHLGHLQFLRVDAVLLSCVCKTAHGSVNGGVIDFIDIDPRFGDLKIFKTLVKQLHQRGIKLILDFPLNHSGDNHPWFSESRKGGNKYQDYYIWHPGQPAADGTRQPPSNWLSRYGGSAWSWDEERQEFYLHQLHRDWPDLNHRNAGVRQEMIESFKFWVDQGVDGISLRDVNLLFEIDELTLSEPRSEIKGVQPGEYAYLDHLYTDDQPEIHEYLATYRELVDSHLRAHKERIFLTVEVEDDMMADVQKYYDTGTDVPLNPFLAGVDDACHTMCVYEILDAWLVEVPEGKPTLWMISSPASGRYSSRVGTTYSKALVVLQYMLPGSVVIHQGDEIGVMSEGEQWADKRSKHERPPLHQQVMAWEARPHGGFTQTAALPAHLHAATSDSVQSQKEHPQSILNIHRKLAELRSDPVLQEGGIKYTFMNADILSFLRFSRQHTPYLVVINMGLHPSTEDYSLSVGIAYGQIMFYTKGSEEERALEYKEGDRIELFGVVMYPGDAMVLKLA